MPEAGGAAGVSRLVDLRQGDLRDPPVTEQVRLVTSPFRALLHAETDEDRAALAAAFRLLVPGGRLVFDVFAPSPEDVAETNGRWLEREPGIWERADWDMERRVLTLRVRGDAAETAMTLSWIPTEDWRRLLEETASRSSPATAGSTCARTRAARTRSGSLDDPATARPSDDPGPSRRNPGTPARRRTRRATPS